jgi:multidrug efflux pump subunit AcrA (membrane-fusion protein)
METPYVPLGRGIVAHVLFTENQRVKGGDLLAELMTPRSRQARAGRGNVASAIATAKRWTRRSRSPGRTQSATSPWPAGSGPRPSEDLFADQIREGEASVKPPR